MRLFLNSLLSPHPFPFSCLGLGPVHKSHHYNCLHGRVNNKVSDPEQDPTPLGLYRSPCPEVKCQCENRDRYIIREITLSLLAEKKR